MSGYPDIIEKPSKLNAPVFSGVTPPTSAGEGALWMNTTDPKNPVLNVYHNGAWVVAAGKLTEQTVQDLIDQSIQLNQKTDETEFIKAAAVAQTGGSPNVIPETDASGKLDPSFIPGGIVDLTPYAKATDSVLKVDLVDTTHGVVDAGKPVKLDANGFIDTSMLKIGGGMNYKGPANPTAGNAPVGAVVGDFYVATVDGTGAAGWPGLTGTPILKGEAVIFDGTNWTIVGASVNAATVYTKTESDAKYYDKTAVDAKFGAAVDSSAGPASAGKLIKLAATGLIDPSMIPPLGGTGNMNWKGYIDAEGNAMPTGAKLGDTYMLARQFAGVESTELDIPLPGSPEVVELEKKYPWLPELHQALNRGDGVRNYLKTTYSANTLLLVGKDGQTWADSISDAAFVARTTRASTILPAHGPGDNVAGIGATILTPPVDVPDIITYYEFIQAKPWKPRNYYYANSFAIFNGQLLQARFSSFGDLSTPALPSVWLDFAAADHPSTAMWQTAKPPSMAKHKIIKSSLDIETSLAQFTPLTPGPTWKGVAGTSMTSGDVVVFDGTKWVNISPRVGRFVTMAQYKAGLAAVGATGSTATSGGVSTSVANEIVRVTELVEKFKEFVANNYETKSDLAAVIKNEQATNGRTYQTIAQAHQDATDTAKQVDTKYLSKADAANSYATSIDLQNHMAAEKSRSDNTYETKADANSAHAAEIARADRLFIQKSEPINKSNGPIDIDKIPKLDASGKLDPSFMPTMAGSTGGMQYKGTTSPAVAPTTPVKGDMWVFATAGALGATFAPLTGNVVKGDAIVFNGTSWDLISKLVDLSAYYTKGEIDAQITAETAAIAAAIAKEVARADTTYQTIAQAGKDMTDEKNRADSTYMTQVQAAVELGKKLNIADAASTYLSQTDAAAQYMSTVAYRQDQLIVSDNIQQTYETKLDAKRAHDGLILRSDNKYLDKTEAVDRSSGISDAGKIPKLNSQGKIDGSMLSIQGGMQLKGSVLPGATAAPGFPSAGWFYLVGADGVMGADWVGVSGKPVKQGEGLIFDGLTWSTLKMTNDLTDFFTKAETSAVFVSHLDLQKLMADAKALADATYETQADAQRAHQNMLKQLSALFVTPSQVATLIGTEQGRADGVYFTKVEAANLQHTIQAALAAAPSKGDMVSASAGPASAGKPVLLNAAGQIDPSMLPAALNPATMYTPAMATADQVANAAKFIAKAGDTMTGPLVLAAAPAADMEAGNKKYIDDADKLKVDKADLVKVSTGATEANKVAQLSADGMLDDSFIHKISASTGATDANKIITTGTDGKIDSSLLNLPGAMIYKGAIDITAATPPAAKAGEFYVNTKAGAIAAGWTGLVGQTAKVGDGIMFDGASWDLLAAEADVSAVVTQLTTEVARAQAAELKLTNDLAAEVTRADTAEKANAANIVLANNAITALTTRVAALEAKLASVTGTATSIKVAGTIEATGDITAFKP